MEIIPEKEDVVKEEQQINQRTSNQNNQNADKKRYSPKSGQIWQPADHPTQITYESHTSGNSEEKSATDTDQSTNVIMEETISDFEDDENFKKKGYHNESHKNKISTSSESSVRTNFVEKNNFLNLSLTSSDDDGKGKKSDNGTKPEVVIVAEISGNITDSIEEEKVDRLKVVVTVDDKLERTKEPADQTRNSDNMIEDLDKSRLNVDDSYNDENYPLEANKSPRTSIAPMSDWETTEAETSDAESVSAEAFTTADSLSPSCPDQRKEKLDFNESGSQGFSCEESVEEESKKDLSSHDKPVSSSSINSSLQSSKHSSVYSSTGDSVSSNSTIVSQGACDWTPEVDSLHTMTLYVQGHSDISLLLLMEESSLSNDRTIPSLVSSSLSNDRTIPSLVSSYDWMS